MRFFFPQIYPTKKHLLQGAFLGYKILDLSNTPSIALHGADAAGANSYAVALLDVWLDEATSLMLGLWNNIVSSMRALATKETLSHGIIELLARI